MNDPKPLFVPCDEDRTLPSLHLLSYATVEINHGGRYGTSNRYVHNPMTLGGRNIAMPVPVLELPDQLYALPRCTQLPNFAKLVERGMADRDLAAEGKPPSGEPFVWQSNALGFDFGWWKLWDARYSVDLATYLEVSNPFGPGFTHYRRRYITEMRVHAERLRGHYVEAATAWAEAALADHIEYRKREDARRQRQENSVPGEVLELPAGR